MIKINQLFLSHCQSFAFSLEKNIILLQNSDQLASIIKSKDKVVVDYFAKWCAPCKKMTPKLEALLNKKQNFKLIKVDVDQHKDLVKENKVTSLPTIFLFKDGKVDFTFKGNNQLKLEELENKI